MTSKVSVLAGSFIGRGDRADLFRLKYLVLFMASILIYSFNYHFLWLFYDVTLIFLAGYYIWNNKISLKYYQWFIIILTLWYFVSISINSGHTFIGLLSTWDTFKHILLFLLLVRIHQYVSGFGEDRFLVVLYRFIFVAFVMQVVFVFFQVKMGVFFDNVAGTFGNGATHSMAYLSLLFVGLNIALKKNIWLVILSILVGTWLNRSAENVGFFVLLPILLFGFLINQKVKLRHTFIALCIAPIVLLLLSYAVYGNTPYGNVILSRVSGYVSGSSAQDTAHVGRGPSLVASVSRGRWLGNGPGSFSNIYLMRGYDYDSKDDPTQINIAESSHLIFESGIIGLALTLMTYSSLLWGYFRRRRNKLFAVVFYTASMFYGSLLMTETQVFLLFVTLFLFRQFEENLISHSKKDKIISESLLTS